VTCSEEALQKLYAEIGRRVRRARMRREWTHLDLAQAVGLTRSSIANLEAGRQRPPVHIALLITQALDVPVDELLPSGPELDEFTETQLPATDLDSGPGRHQGL
jgi:transcriptional regulator with XRE-family HTH domain